VTLFDYLVLFVLICSVIISTMRGLVREILSLVSWIVAFVVANAYGQDMAGFLPTILPTMIPGDLMRLTVGFLVLLIGVRLMMLLFTLAVEALIKSVGLTVADRGLGGLFGLGRGLIIVLAAVMLCGTTSIPQQPFWKDALLSPLAETTARTIKPFLPGTMARYVKF
jgi:membrane protein required for colicin V production